MLEEILMNYIYLLFYALQKILKIIIFSNYFYIFENIFYKLIIKNVNFTKILK